MRGVDEAFGAVIDGLRHLAGRGGIIAPDVPGDARIAISSRRWPRLPRVPQTPRSAAAMPRFTPSRKRAPSCSGVKWTSTRLQGSGCGGFCQRASAFRAYVSRMRLSADAFIFPVDLTAILAVR